MIGFSKITTARIMDRLRKAQPIFTTGGKADTKATIRHLRQSCSK